MHSASKHGSVFRVRYSVFLFHWIPIANFTWGTVRWPLFLSFCFLFLLIPANMLIRVKFYSQINVSCLMGEVTHSVEASETFSHFQIVVHLGWTILTVRFREQRQRFWQMSAKKTNDFTPAVNHWMLWEDFCFFLAVMKQFQKWKLTRKLLCHCFHVLKRKIHDLELYGLSSTRVENVQHLKLNLRLAKLWKECPMSWSGAVVGGCAAVCWEVLLVHKVCASLWSCSLFLDRVWCSPQSAKPRSTNSTRSTNGRGCLEMETKESMCFKTNFGLSYFDAWFNFVQLWCALLTRETNVFSFSVCKKEVSFTLFEVFCVQKWRIILR